MYHTSDGKWIEYNMSLTTTRFTVHAHHVTFGVSKIFCCWIESKMFHREIQVVSLRQSVHLCSTQYMDGSLSCAGGRLWKYGPLKVRRLCHPLSMCGDVVATCFVESSWSAHKPLQRSLLWLWLWVGPTVFKWKVSSFFLGLKWA